MVWWGMGDYVLEISNRFGSVELVEFCGVVCIFSGCVIIFGLLVCSVLFYWFEYYLGEVFE